MEATDPVTITLQAQQWNVIIDVLHNAPYRTVAAIIGSIIEQATAATSYNQQGNGVLNRDAWGNGSSEDTTAAD